MRPQAPAPASPSSCWTSTSWRSRRRPPRAWEAAPDDVVFHQLTSGSTGIPKCIQETHRGILHHIEGSRLFNGFTSDDVDLNWLPFDHVVPTLTCHLKDTYLGLRQVQVRTEAVLAEPLLWLELLETYGVTHSWAPNFGFKLVCDALSRAPARRFDLSRLVSLMNAGEQITPPVVEEFLRRTGPFGILPRVMQPAYGMAEVCTCMTYRNGFAPDTGVRRILKSSLGGHLEAAAAAAGDSAAIGFVDVGPPIPGVEIRIAGPDRQPLPELVIGRLQIRGEVVTPGYLHNAEANREAFVGEGWFDTGDLGFIAGGSLTITGREKEEIIIIRGANYYCYEIEDVVNAIAGVEPTWAAACAVERTRRPAPSRWPSSSCRAAPALDPDYRSPRSGPPSGREFSVVPACVLPLTRESFPKTTSGKIQRTQLKRRLAAGDFTGLLQQVDLATGNDSTVPRWCLAPAGGPTRPAVRARRRPDGATLVLADGGGIADALVPLLGPPGLVVRAEAVAGAFARRSRQSYALDPRREADLGMLVAALSEDGVEVARVVHLWSCDRGGDGGDGGDRGDRGKPRRPRQRGPPGRPGRPRPGRPGRPRPGRPGRRPRSGAAAPGSYSLLALAQALARAPRGDVPVRLLTASISMAGGAGADEPAPEHAPLLGLIKTLPLEWPWLECRHVHLPVAAPAANAERLAAELEVLDKDREVAYRRGGERCIRRLLPVEPRPQAEPPFAPGAMVLVSGGLGGIGCRIARDLAGRRACRLLLLGRSRLDDDDGPEAAAEASAIAARTGRGERRERLARLQELGSEVAYEAVDVADAERLEQAVGRWEERWRRPGSRQSSTWRGSSRSAWSRRRRGRASPPPCCRSSAAPRTCAGCCRRERPSSPSARCTPGSARPAPPPTPPREASSTPWPRRTEAPRRGGAPACRGATGTTPA